MGGVRLEGDWSKLKNNLHKLGNVNFTGLHKEIGEQLLSTTQQRFKTERGPDGRKWTPSIRARSEGGQTLSQTRRLRNSITTYARPDRVAVGTNDIRARIHQYGGTITPKRARVLRFQIGTRWAVKKSVTIPARPYLGISEDDEGLIQDIIRERFEEALR